MLCVKFIEIKILVFFCIINWCGYLLVALTSSWIPKEVRLSIGVLLRLSRITHLYPQVASFYFITKGLFSCPSFGDATMLFQVGSGMFILHFGKWKGIFFKGGVLIWEGLISGFYVLFTQLSVWIHRQNVIHADLKPENILFEEGEVVCLQQTNHQKIWFNLMDLKSLPF